MGRGQSGCVWYCGLVRCAGKGIKKSPREGQGGLWAAVSDNGV